MNAQTAMELANVWLEAHGEQTQSHLELRQPLVQALQEAIPDSAQTGVGMIEAKPKVLALAGDLFIILNLVGLDSPNPRRAKGHSARPEAGAEALGRLRERGTGGAGPAFDEGPDLDDRAKRGRPRRGAYPRGSLGPLSL
jgi:hypothetical protein